MSEAGAPQVPVDRSSGGAGPSTLPSCPPLTPCPAMVKAKDGTDSVESFELETAEEESEEDEEDDEEDAVFVKKGRHGSENGAAKKPLIKGSQRNGARNGAMQTEIREGWNPRVDAG